MFRILFHAPEIPGNTGNAIRLAAITGAELHLVEIGRASCRERV